MLAETVNDIMGMVATKRDDITKDEETKTEVVWTCHEHEWQEISIESHALLSRRNLNRNTTRDVGLLIIFMAT